MRPNLGKRFSDQLVVSFTRFFSVKKYALTLGASNRRSMVYGSIGRTKFSMFMPDWVEVFTITKIETRVIMDISIP